MQLVPVTEGAFGAGAREEPGRPPGESALADAGTGDTACPLVANAGIAAARRNTRDHHTPAGVGGGVHVAEHFRGQKGKGKD